MAGFRLGSILGLEIRIDASWFVIFLLVLWTLSAGLFPARYPGLTTAVYLVMGLAGTLAFFASLVVHELSHSVVARSRGIAMEGITLFIFGGMARAEREAERPGDELAIAIVGPLASLALAAGFQAVAWAGGALGWPEAVTGVAQYLATINLVLAVFNMLPGFPMDGGRVFRALVWRATGDLTRATRWATTGGRWLGHVLMATGLLALFLTGDLLGGMWLVLIGWFIRNAAAGSLSQHLLLEALEGVRVTDLMTPAPVTVRAALPVSEVVERYFLRLPHPVYPVVDEDGSVVGVVSLARVQLLPRSVWPDRAARDVMQSVEAADFADWAEPMAAGLEKLSRTPEGRLLVLRDGSLAGILTRADVARWLERARLTGRPLQEA